VVIGVFRFPNAQRSSWSKPATAPYETLGGDSIYAGPEVVAGTVTANVLIWSIG
jgi:hypothetical protein